MKVKNVYFFATITLLFFCFSFGFVATTANAKATPSPSPSPTVTPTAAPTEEPAPEKPTKNRFRLNVTKLNLAKDTAYTLRVYNMKKSQTVAFTLPKRSCVSFKSRSSKHRKAKIVANTIGKTKITVTIRKNGKIKARLYCNVMVTPPALTIKFSKKELFLVIGENYILAPIIKPSTTSEIPIYTTTNPLVATINSKGRITTWKAGTCEITAKLSNGVSTTCKVTVSSDEQTYEEMRGPEL